MTFRDAAEVRPLVGDVIAGKYRIEGVAGEGGMGVVYEAEHVILRQRVALKVLVRTAPSTDAIERFSFEASVIAGMNSEHVVRVMDAGSLPTGAPYFVMEYLEGCDLEELLARRGPLPPREVVDYALQALEALACVHAARVIHRDLKPSNLFLAQARDGHEVVKLVDFGASTSFDFSSSSTGGISGSPLYMSPEQIRNAPLDLRSDLWSLGVVLYELLSGKPPFAGSLAELARAVLEDDAAPLSRMRLAVGHGLSQVLARCLQRDPANRWQTTMELAEALAPYGSGAWSGALERIERALSTNRPRLPPRRFESFENALQALEADVRPETVGETMPAPSRPSDVSTLRILLIDDSQIALEIHGLALTSAGFAVRTTTSPREFDALLEHWRPHLVLMDVRMPAVPGDVLCRRVKAKYGATMPVVFVSDQPPTQLANRAKFGGADAYFSKTSDTDAFLAFVKNICAMTYSPEHLP